MLRNQHICLVSLQIELVHNVYQIYSLPQGHRLTYFSIAYLDPSDEQGQMSWEQKHTAIFKKKD